MLLDHYGDDHEAAAQHMLYLMGTARENAARALGIAPAKLYRRFVSWTLPKGHTCRMCGTRGHEVLPGWPIRLFPCDGSAVQRLTEPEDEQGACATALSSTSRSVDDGLL